MSEQGADLDDDRYPTEETLARIREWPWEEGTVPPPDWRGLMAFVKSIWWPDAEYGWRERRAGGATVYTIATGGWSGNEDVIGAMADNRLFWSLCWVSSRRGGAYTFRSTTPAKAAAARKNGKKGGRPPKKRETR